MSSARHRAIYPGSFDPITKGHIDVLERACKLFDEVYLAIAASSSKRSFFSLHERSALAIAAVQGYRNARVSTFSGLLVEYAATINAGIILRGLRAVSDFEYEVQLAAMNRQLAPALETVFIAASSEHSFVSSSLVRELAQAGGDVSRFVPEQVARALEQAQRGKEAL